MRKLIVLLFVLTMIPVVAESQVTPTWCKNRNNSYCTYGWNRVTGCCYATYTAPGADCPSLCL